MTKMYDKYELFDLIRGPEPMKDLCDKYNKLKGKDVFKDFFDNGDCEFPGEIDWIYNGCINHLYDGDFYEISCGVRDSFDKTIDIFPEVWFSIGLELNSINSTAKNSIKSINDYPRLEEFSKSFSIKNFSDFVNAVDGWQTFAKEGAERIRKNRNDWLEYLSPAPDTKMLYSYIKKNLPRKIELSLERTLEFKKQPSWTEEL